MTLDRALDLEGDPLIPAELMALIIGNMADCRHVRMLCSDPRYAAICTQQLVYNMFVGRNGWILPDNFTMQDFNQACNYYSNFLQHNASITPELYDRRMEYVTFIESFVIRIYNQTLQFPFDTDDGSIEELQKDFFCNGIINNIDDAINQFVDPPFEHIGITISGTPDDDDFVFNSYEDEDGESEPLTEDMRDMNEGIHIYIMVFSNLNHPNQNNFVVHHISVNDSIRDLFTAGGVGANEQVVNQHRRETVQKITLFLIHHINLGLCKWRQYLEKQDQELPNTDPVLYTFAGPPTIWLQQ